MSANEATAATADVQARIAGLYVYPVKSCAGISQDESLLTETGLDLDRAWMVVDEAGMFVSQREEPRLALIQPAFKRAGTELQLRAPGMLTLHLHLDAVEAPTWVRVWDDLVSAYDMGDIAAQWFTDFLAQELPGLHKDSERKQGKYRLARFDPSQRRLSSLDWTGGLEAANQFSDGYPLLVLSLTALDELNQRLQARGYAKVDVRRFRPNIVLQDMHAHDEDRVGLMHIATAQGPVVLKPVKPCTRCTIPNIDPDSAHSSPQLSDVLQTYRQDARVKGALTFGMNAIIVSGLDRVLRVGQTVRADYCFD